MSNLFIDEDGKSKARVYVDPEGSGGESTGYIFVDKDGKAKVRVFIDGGTFEIAPGTITADMIATGAVTDTKIADPKVNRVGDTMTGPLDILVNSNGRKMQIGKTQAQSGNNNAPTTLDLNSTYLIIGGTEYNTNSYRLIGFGYHRHGEGSHSPVVIGYQEINAGKDDMGDFIVATRNSTSDVAPIVQLRIKSDGQVELEQAAYAPGSDKAVPNKKYVDAYIKTKISALQPIGDPATATSEEIAQAYNDLLTILKS